MNILIWPTTFGADLWSFTRYLSRHTAARIRIVMKNPDLFRRQGVAELFPLDVEFIRRRSYHYLTGAPFFRPDVTIMDNRTPLMRTSPKALMLWHGFGWKGPNDEHELRWLHRSLTYTWGDVRRPNPRFRFQCFGPWDFEHRTEVSGFHPANCRILGAAGHDDLRTPLDRRRARPYYPFDVAGRKTVLIAPTWHYGEVFAHWGTDADLLERLVTRIEQRGASVILRLHDDYRFSKDYRAFLENLAARHPRVLLKFKNRAPDNYLDLQVADVLITNFSSIANLFYATGRPTVHIYPVNSADEAFMWREYTLAGVRTQEIDKARYIWKLPPEDNGGLLARSFDELLDQVDRSLAEPDCCREQAQAFLDRHMLGADGRSCVRIWETLVELAEN